MPVEVIMPKVDMDMTAGRIVKWHVAEGAAVEKAAALFDIETDKAVMEVESPAAGRLHHIQAAEGARIGVGEPVAWLYAEGEALGPPPGAAAAHGAPEAAPPAPVAPDPAPPAPVGAVRASPLARRRAREGGIDLRALSGTSANGRISRGDVEAALAAPPRAEPALQAPDGAGAPLLLIHGFAADASAWARLEAALPAGLPVLRLELPCHGAAPRLPIAGFPDLAQAARRAFDALGDGQVHLVGHSLGGAVALALVDTRPRRVASLTLIAPAGLGPDVDGAMIAGLLRATRAESLAPWLKRLPADPDSVTWDYVLAAMARREDPALRAAQIAMAAALFPDGVQAFDLRPALHRCRVTARIVWGRADTVIPWRHALEAPGRVGLHLFEATGHLPHFERADEVAALLAETARLPVPAP